MNENTKSTSGTRMHASGRIRSGKCTFCTSIRFERTQAAVSVKTAARNVHGDEVQHREDRIRQALRREVGELPEDRA